MKTYSAGILSGVVATFMALLLMVWAMDRAQDIVVRDCEAMGMRNIGEGRILECSIRKEIVR